MNGFRSAKGFLTYGGIVLVVVGILGFFGIIGPMPETSLFGENWFFTLGENWAHLLLGIVGLGAAYLLKDESMLKGLTVLVGVIAVLAAVYGFFLTAYPPNNLGVANLENPMDTILHIVVAVWAFWSLMGSQGSSSMPA